MFDDNDFEQLLKLENKKTTLNKYILFGLFIIIFAALIILYFLNTENEQKIADNQEILLAKHEPPPVVVTSAVKINKTETALIKVNKNTISIVSDKVQLRPLLQEFAKKFNLNLLLSNQITGKVSLALRNIAWQEAFDNILLFNNLGSVYQKNIIFIAPYDELKKISVAKKPLRQVQIEARMVRVNHHFINDLGINWNLEEKSFLSTAGKLIFSKELNNDFIDPKLSLYESQGMLETLSNPKIVVSEDKAARIEQGQSIPYQEIAKYGATATSFKNAALSMRVTPHLSESNKILLDLAFSNNFANLQNKVNNYPVIETQELETQILVNDRSTIVLGGIISDMKMKNSSKVPGMGSLPLLGNFFKNTAQNNDKSEFFIFLTATVLK